MMTDTYFLESIMYFFFFLAFYFIMLDLRSFFNWYLLLILSLIFLTVLGLMLECLGLVLFLILNLADRFEPLLDALLLVGF